MLHERVREGVRTGLEANTKEQVEWCCRSSSSMNDPGTGSGDVGSSRLATSGGKCSLRNVPARLGSLNTCLKKASWTLANCFDMASC